MSSDEKYFDGMPESYWREKRERQAHPAEECNTELKLKPCSFPPFVETAFVFAARYTHHRNTGGTLAVCRALAYVWPDLSESTKEQILKESHEATTNLREWREFRGGEQ